MKQPTYIRLKLDKIVGGGQAIGTADDGRKVFVWGGLPGEEVTVRITKKKSKLLEAVVTEVHVASPDRIEPHDPDSYLSTSPWQIVSFDAEQRFKGALIDEAFVQHHTPLPEPAVIATDGVTERYRNKVEFSWYGSTTEGGEETLDLAFFRRGSKGKIVVKDSALLPEAIIELAHQIRDDLHKLGVSARQLKTLLIRSDQEGGCVWQLYAKDESLTLPEDTMTPWPAKGGEVIYSDPRSPASRITKRQQATGDVVLQDNVLDVPFRYATEGFFQINLPVYELSLRDMKRWVDSSETEQTLDLYSGVGTIGLTIGGDNCTLVEINQDAVREMRRNIERLDSQAVAVLASSESALDQITNDKLIIVDPPRAGLHADVVDRLLETKPNRIIYLSCNPSTQARDVTLLSDKYDIVYHRGYNFFPRTPHIENLVVLDARTP